MDTVYLVTRPDGKKKCYFFPGKLEKEEGFVKGSIKSQQRFPVGIGSYIIEKVEYESSL